MALDLVKVSQELSIAETVVKALTPTQLGWLALEKNKRTTFTNLQNQTLIVQGFLNNIAEEEDWEKCKNKIAEASSAYGVMKEMRLKFTNGIKEKLVQPAMEFEKSCDELFDKAKARELELRKIAEKAAWDGNAKQREEQEFVAHFKNEGFRVAAAYRVGLQKMITYFYVQALEKKMPVTKLKTYKEEVANQLRTLAVDKPAIFKRTLISEDRAIELFGTIMKYNPENDLRDAINSIEDRFGMYANDLKNKDAAISSATQQQETLVAEVDRKLTIETATNSLAAQSVGELEATAPKVKRLVVVEIEDTDQWVFSVLGAFIANWQQCKAHLKVKTWANLSIKQMADALGKVASETGERFEGLTFKTVEK